MNPLIWGADPDFMHLYGGPRFIEQLSDNVRARALRAAARAHYAYARRDDTKRWRAGTI